MTSSLVPDIKEKVVLELNVRNHPGVKSHVCGLFAGILCKPVGEGVDSRIWLLVREDERLPQMIAQVEKLVDVISVARHGAEHVVFERLEDFFC